MSTCKEEPNIIQEVIINGTSPTENPSIELPIESDDVIYVTDSVTVTTALDDLYSQMADFQAQIDELNYSPMEIESFSTTIDTFEVGSTVSSLTFNWVLNKNSATQTLTGGFTQVVTPVSLRTYTKTGLSITVNSTFTLTCIDGTAYPGNTDIETTSINFYNGVYYGVSVVPGVYNSAFIQSLTKELREDREVLFQVTAGSSQYPYFSIPVAYGTPTFTVGGFEGGFELAATISYTNPSGYTENYNIYKSVVDNLGEIIIEVS